VEGHAAIGFDQFADVDLARNGRGYESRATLLKQFDRPLAARYERVYSRRLAGEEKGVISSSSPTGGVGTQKLTAWPILNCS
jgi:hypothetical protein